MHATALVLSLLLAQIPPAQTPVGGASGGRGKAAAAPSAAVPDEGKAPAAPEEPPAAPAGAATPPLDPPHQSSAPLVAVPPRPVKRHAAELLSGALAVPEGGRITGRAVTLVEVLRAGLDRASQLRATESYWKLAAAVADFHFAGDELDQLERLKPAAAPDRPLTTGEQILATRMAVAQARLHDAELAVVASQYELAATMRIPGAQPLPLPADQPHVGAYNTFLDRVYAGRVAPARAVLIDRTLPVRRDAIEARAAAVVAATEALDAVEESYYGGQADLPLVLSLIDELAQQRRALVADVRTYNNEIAEYALAVPVVPANPEGLVAMLIKTPGGRETTVASGATGGAGSGIERAGFNQPVGGATPAAPPPARSGSPTHVPAPPTNFPKPPAAGAGSSTTPRREAQKLSEQELSGGTELAVPVAVQALYPGLYDLSSTEQARHLASVLFWHDHSATADVQPTALADYLSAVPAARRRDAIAAYWQAQHRAAMHAVVEQEIEQLDTLGAAVSEAAETSHNALLVRAAQMAAEADSLTTRAESLAAQSALTVAADRPVNGKWLAPQTAPHAGGYRLALDELPRELGASVAIQRLVVEIPKRQQSAVEHAAAVVSADQQRAKHEIAPTAPGADTYAALAAIHRQASETLAFLDRVADYNIDIAEYATLVLPPSTSSGEFAQALVLQPSAAAAP